MASPRFANTSLRDSPCVAHPGMEGASAQYPPSFALWITTFSCTVLDLVGRSSDVLDVNGFSFYIRAQFRSQRFIGDQIDRMAQQVFQVELRTKVGL